MKKKFVLVMVGVSGINLVFSKILYANNLLEANTNKMLWQQNYDPLGNIWLSSLIAALPIFFFFFCFN